MLNFVMVLRCCFCLWCPRAVSGPKHKFNSTSIVVGRCCLIRGDGGPRLAGNPWLRRLMQSTASLGAFAQAWGSELVGKQSLDHSRKDHRGIGLSTVVLLCRHVAGKMHQSQLCRLAHSAPAHCSLFAYGYRSRPRLCVVLADGGDRPVHLGAGRREERHSLSAFRRQQQGADSLCIAKGRTRQNPNPYFWFSHGFWDKCPASNLRPNCCNSMYL